MALTETKAHEVLARFDPEMHNRASAALAGTFGMEYAVLREDDARLVRIDFLEAGIASSEYARRIGAGNLQAYADTMQARFRHGWD